MQDYQNGTQCLHAGYVPENGEPRNIPIVQSTTFRYATSEAMGKPRLTWRQPVISTPACKTPPSDRGGGQDLRPGGRHGGHADLLRPGGQLLRHLQHLPPPATMWWPPATIYGGTFNLFCRHHEAHGHRVHLCGPGLLRGGAERRLPAQHQGRVRRDHRQPRPDGAGH